MFFVLTDLFNDQYQRKTSKYSNIHTKTVRTDFDLQKLWLVSRLEITENQYKAIYQQLKHLNHTKT